MMKNITFGLLSLLIGVNEALPSPRDLSYSAEAATSFSITYGQPLLAFQQLFNAVSRAIQPPVNKFVAMTALATPNDTAVVEPNVDTLYMGQMYDVSRDDVGLVIGEVDANRYWSAGFYTPYGDNYINIGAVRGTKPGTYLLTVPNCSTTVGVIQADTTGKYEGVITSPSTFGVILIRILLRNTDEDLQHVTELQKGFSSGLVARAGAAIGPELTANLFENSSSSQLEYIMDLTARFAEAVPPTPDEPLVPASTTAKLVAAGINVTDGLYQQPEGVNITRAAIASNIAIQAIPTSSNATMDLGNNWWVLKPEYMGDFGTHYVARAYIARNTYLGLDENEVLYPSYSGEFSLQQNESYTIRFFGKPPITDVGFWSLTMYNSEGYLVENSVDRYTIGDRSNITYADGTQVYQSQVNSTFDILVQASQPNQSLVSNWLPSPPEGGPFIMLLRFYAPQETLRNGGYTLPEVTKGSTVVG